MALAAARLPAASLMAWLLLWPPGPARALDPSLEASQYGHDSWSTRRGDFRGNIQSIAQTTDGYLWLGTDFGLLRFDGARFLDWQPPPGQPLSRDGITALLGGRDGSLWIGGRGLSRWHGGALRRFSEIDDYLVRSLVEDREGTVWVAAAGRQRSLLCAIRGGLADCQGQDGRFGDLVGGLYEDPAGALWLGGAGALWRLRPGPPQRFREPYDASTPAAITEDAEGRLLVASGLRLRRIAGDRLETWKLEVGGQAVWPSCLLKDRDGVLWVGTAGEGIFHLANGRWSRFTRADGLSSDSVFALAEDREGNVWASTSDGLDRLSDLAVATLTVRQGLSNSEVTSVLAARDGGVWLAAPGGLNRLIGGRVEKYGPESGLPDQLLSLLEDRHGRLWVSSMTRGLGFGRFENGRYRPTKQPFLNVFQMAETSAGEIWVTTREQGLGRIDGEATLHEYYQWSSLDDRVALSVAPDERRGGVWLGFMRGGVGFLEKGKLAELYEEAQGLGRGQVRDLRLDGQGALWAATQGGLSRVSGGKVANLDSGGGLPCDAVHWAREVDGATWLYQSCGLVRLAAGQLTAWAADPGHRVVVAEWLDQTDGVDNTMFNGYYTPTVAVADGRLYFAPASGGLSLLDPRRRRADPAPELPVLVEQLAAGGQTYSTGVRPRLPPEARDLQFDYTAIHLKAPHKLQFRYLLEGYDAGWQEAGKRRQAFYSDLPPGDYRFRVAASIDGQAWTEGGAALELEILPAYYQTFGFRCLALTLLLGLAFLAYRWRVSRVQARLAWQFEERLAERTRIAGELHDTLLQGFISASMQLALAFGRLPADLPEKPRLEKVLALVRRVIDEGRDAVRGLRSEMSENDDLERAFARIPGEIGSEQEIAVKATGEERARPLRALVRDEVYRIGREAVVNAVRHSRAATIEVEIEHQPKAFVLRVADDGIGIAAETLAKGRQGHWGLAGMRERAARLGARFEVGSRPGDGTRIELRLPAAAAFESGTADSGPGRRSLRYRVDSFLERWLPSKRKAT